ncbi:MAG: hypothetical protein DCC65_09815 [Planctomycetota bacterium]|nr:MAG: hypothetical protein DCC65_09815 [Planctomycetota bacterium]
MDGSLLSKPGIIRPTHGASKQPRKLAHRTMIRHSWNASWLTTWSESNACFRRNPLAIGTSG